MNHETIALEEKFEAVIIESEHLSAIDIARLLLKECKDSGLRWYDGKNDRFKEIE